MLEFVTIPPLPVEGATCPEVRFDGVEPRHLRDIADACHQISVNHPNEARHGLCHMIEYLIGYGGASKEFGESMAAALGGFAYLDSYLTEVHDRLFDRDSMLEIRWAWAAHIARSIYEQIGG